eukprot:CAMPEP_0174749238 /NCGR_PEP_ID=MMETSP1094-20130205/95239_1 /TAXON_ID=156173 /ORGANISM="Chrysochromulina brevifilum, Strain UTEX LB 985" /LENGTH=50 /DNA_ID=CAMNT_0015954413 /DNA_START=183 /DNA_END=332 /DNA_ORIENTATION=+
MVWVIGQGLNLNQAALPRPQLDTVVHVGFPHARERSCEDLELAGLVEGVK